MPISETIEVNVVGLGQLDAMAAAADKTAAAMDKLRSSAAGGAGAGADKMASAMEAAAAAIEASVAKIQGSLDKLAGTGDAAAAGLERVGSAAEASAGGLEASAASADAAAAAQDRLAGSADAGAAALDRTAAAGKRAGESAAAGGTAASGGGSKLKEMALGAALTLGYAVDRAMKFNSQMTLLNTQAGVSKSQMGELNAGVLKLAGQVGQSPGSLAESLFHVESNMASLGIKAPQALNMVKIAAEGASVGHANLVDTTNALTAAVASGIPGVKNYSQAMGVLNATVGSGDMSMQDLTDAMGTGVLAVIKGYGANIKDAGAALAVFGDNNIRGAKAGTDLRMAVQSLAVPAASAKTQLKELGLTSTTLADNMQQHGLLSTLELLNTKFKQNGITAANEGQMITELFGKKAGVGLAILMEQMTRLQSKYPDLTRSANDFGQAWNQTLQTPQQKLKNLEQGAQAMAITLGNIALPAASKIMSGLDTGMQWIQSHSAASKALTLGLGTLVTGALAKGVFNGVEAGLSGIGKLGSLLKIPGLSNLANLGKSGSQAASGAALEGAATSLDGSATALDGAAEALAGAAAKMDVGSVLPSARNIPEPSAGWPVTEEMIAAKTGATTAGAGAAEGAAAGGVLSKVKNLGLPGIGAYLGPIAAGVTAAEMLRGYSDSQAPAGTPTGKLSNTIRKAENNDAMSYETSGLQAKAATSSAGMSIGSFVNSALKDLFGGGNVHAGTSAQPAIVAGPFGGFVPATAASPQAAPVASSIPSQSFQLSHGGAAATMRLPSPDTSALEQARAKVQSAMAQITVDISKAAAHPAKIPAPDVSALEQAKGKLQQDMAQIDQALSKSTSSPVKIPAPDLSAITSAAGKAQSAVQQITTSLNQALSKPAKAAAPDLSAYTAAAGTARGDGVAVGSGFAAGISSQAGAVAAAAASLAAAATAALHANLKISSPSKVTTTIGQQTGAGLAAGIAASTTAVKQSSTNIGSSSIASIIQGLQGGQSNLQNAQQALLGSLANPDAVNQIQQTILGLEQSIPASDKTLLGQLSQYQTQLTALANKQGALEAQISNATQLATSQVGNASIMNAAGYQPALNASNGGSGGPQSAITTLTGMGYMAADQAQFASQLAQAQKMGLNATSLSQIAQSGASQGLPILQGITQGGPQAVAKLNQLEAQILASSKKIGTIGGTAMYQSGMDITAGLATGLKKDLAGIDTAMTKMADQIVALVKKKLKIASPSQVMADEVGVMIPAGVAAGVLTGTPAAVTAVQQMTQRAMSAARTAQSAGGPAGFGVSGGGQQQAQETHVHLYLDSQHITTQVVSNILERQNSNWQSGVVLPGRSVS